MNKFFEGFSGELGKTWLLRVLSPAAIFWAIGALATSGGLASFKDFGKSLETLSSASGTEWLPVAIAALAWVAASAWLVDRLTLPVLRLLEGYWWSLFGFRDWRIRVNQKLHAELRSEWSLLDNLRARTISQSIRRAELDDLIKQLPSRDRTMPTTLGNILCAAETRPIGRYGLDAVSCWPQLWLLLPKDHRDEISAARAGLDDCARLWLWSALILVWSYWVSWLAIVALVGVWISYRLALLAAAEYADLVSATFDVRRMLLYDAVGWPKPENPEQEAAEGAKLAQYLFRGSPDPTPEFTFAKKDKPTEPPNITIIGWPP